MHQHAALFKALKDIEQHRIESAGSDRIEEGADLIVTGNLRHTSQGLDVIVPVGVSQATLVFHKRGRFCDLLGCIMDVQRKRHPGVCRDPVQGDLLDSLVRGNDYCPVRMVCQRSRVHNTR